MSRILFCIIMTGLQFALAAGQITNNLLLLAFQNSWQSSIKLHFYWFLLAPKSWNGAFTEKSMVSEQKIKLNYIYHVQKCRTLQNRFSGLEPVLRVAIDFDIHFFGVFNTQFFVHRHRIRILNLRKTNLILVNPNLISKLINTSINSSKH